MSARTLCLALAWLLGCAGATGATAEPSTSTSDVSAPAEAGAEADVAGPEPSSSDVDASEPELVSVSPNINDGYMKPGAVEKWTDRLEREKREVIEHREAIVEALELEPGMAVADIGAGTGAFIAAISVELGDSGTLYAVDIAPLFLEHLRARATTEALGNVVVVEGSATATNLSEASVDLLFICDVYHHLEYPSVYLQSLYKSLRPDGRMVIVEFDKVPGKTSAAMLEHVRQDRPTLLAEVTAEGFVLEREITSVNLEENYMLVFRK